MVGVVEAEYHEQVRKLLYYFLLSVQDVGGHWRDDKMVGEIEMYMWTEYRRFLSRMVDDGVVVGIEA